MSTSLHTLCRLAWAAVLLVGGLSALPAPAVAGELLTITCGATGRELDLCREAADGWARATGNRVELVTMPSTDTLSLTQQLLAAGSSEIDVFQIDVAWSGILAEHLLDLQPWAQGRTAAPFAALQSSAEVRGRQVGIPWFADAGVLYYRRDLLARYGERVPQTWRELTATAARIQQRERAAGHPGLWGFVWQGRTYEGLTCNALEWVASFGGGTVVDAQGHVTIHNAQAARALTLAASWVNTISPEGVLNYGEEEARGVFQSGNAVFMRNWPYAWSLVNSAGSQVRGQVGMAALPAGDAPAGRPVATLAGSLLAVNRNSRHTALAADLVLHLTSVAEQKHRAMEASYNPTVPALYADPQVLHDAPYLGELADTFSHAVARPSAAVGSKYNRVSLAFANAVHSVLAGESPADARLQALDDQLRRMRRGGRW